MLAGSMLTASDRLNCQKDSEMIKFVIYITIFRISMKYALKQVQTKPSIG